MASSLDNADKRRLQTGLNSTRTGNRVWTVLQAAEDTGVVASATLAMANQPTDADTIDIGADTYQFAATNVTDDTYIAVLIGATAGDTRDNLIAAINATSLTNENASINNIADSAPALANGTEPVVADEVGTTVRIRSAENGPGGAVLAASPSIVLAESITDAADIWEQGNVNLNTLAGREPGSAQHAMAELTVTAAMITNGARVDLPFTPSRWVAQVHTSAGVVRPAGADAFAIGDGGIAVTFGGGVSPDIQATDVLVLQAWE